MSVIAIGMLPRAKFIVLGFLVIVAFLSGCVSTTQLTYEKNRHYIESGVIGVTKSHFIPNITSNITIRGKDGGAVDGLLSGLVICLQSIKGTPLLALVCLPFGVTVGPISGALMAEYESVLEYKESNLLQVPDTLDVQNAVRDIILEYSKSNGLKIVPLTTLATVPSEKNTAHLAPTQPPVDTLLEVSVTDIFIEGEGWKEIPFRLKVKGHATLKHIKSKQLLDSMEIWFYTRQRDFSVWSENHFFLLKEEIKNASRYMAEQALDELLLLYHYKGNIKTNNLLAPHLIEPIYPKPSYHFNVLQVFSKEFAGAGPSNRDITDVDEANLTFKWMPLPPSLQPIKDELTNISYDFRLYEAEYSEEESSFFPSRLIYSKSKISEPQYKIDSSLKLCGRYFWTVRARFILNGYPRITEWSRDDSGETPWDLRRNGETYHHLNSDFFYAFRVRNCD